MKKLKRILSLCLCFVFLCGFLSITGYCADVKTGLTTVRLNVRSGPGTNYKILTVLPEKFMITIFDKVSSDTTVDPWYLVEFNYNGTFYSGCYVSSTYVSVIGENISDVVPAEYEAYISVLKSKHPNWNFKFLYTGLDWNKVMEGENELKRSLISRYNNPESYFSKADGAYNSSTGTYIPLDGTSWYQAHPQVVAYYVDPRNFLSDDKYLFQFETLSYDASAQNLSGLNKILNNTFMNNAYIQTGEQSGSADLTGDSNVDIADAMKLFQFVSGKISTLGNYYSRVDFTGDGNVDIADAMKLFQFVSGKIPSIGSSQITYAEAFMKAGQASLVSPYHLAARVIQEVGTGGSGSTSGNYGSYPGIYNFYNIGAYAGSDPISNGLKWASDSAENEAYLRPWNNQYKSIVGGAVYIGESYINEGQNTLYLQKFDVESNFNGTYWHQYMSNIQAPVSESTTIYKNYSNMSMLDNSFTFVIPYYNNMPSTPCLLPAK